MKFYVDSNGFYQLIKEDCLFLLKRQGEFYNQLTDDLFDKNKNIIVLKELFNDIENGKKNGLFPPRDIYINENNYLERNKRAVCFFPIYMSFGIALMRSYHDYFKRTNDRLFNINDTGINVIDLNGRMNEVENEFKRLLDYNLHNPNDNIPLYGVTMLIISLIERAICNNLINIVFKDFIQKLNGKISLEQNEEKIWNAGVSVFLKEESPNAFEDIDDFESDLVNIFCKNSKLLNLNSDARRDLSNLINKTPPTLNSLINNSFAKKYIDKTILNFLKILFDSDINIGLNLRNDIMHCNTNKLYEPSGFPITTIMLHILVLVLHFEIFN